MPQATVGKRQSLVTSLSQLQLGKETNGKQHRLELEVLVDTALGARPARALLNYGADLNLVAQQ
jgi:hypothetical protein